MNMDRRFEATKDIIAHGGSLSRARALFGNAPQPWVDLSTGINPHSYPYSPLASSHFSRLPEQDEARHLLTLAAPIYGAPSPFHIVAAPGTQILLPLLCGRVKPGKAAILSPTYAEHARAARLAGHEVSEVRAFEQLYDADLAIVVNPNNPDGKVTARTSLLDLAHHLRRKGGLLIVDEAFMDIGPREESLSFDVRKGAIIVLRSFGKFFGLAGVRLGFALASQEIAADITASLGPWAISGPAQTIALEAFADGEWQTKMREQLALEALRMDALLEQHGLEILGGTNLFRLVQAPDAVSLFRRLGRNGVIVRNFADRPHVLRFGLPGNETAWERLASALAG
ncbi:threonine-phosphate decarboxylase CobD [Limoniibacter endophyticus]|uniref:threonine-phosphate decarboxylase n=1 Tax=Limoniibacter endophyticus TaxID=1565040 RepID=A0A8J3GHD5_9HYPH|nr:threonine-phosphate decarboxylase CobD [Limoniibacter endophyticus]GHC78399.1 threonine-phosphate decarboxylase [Limoniibacter endophyticus]